MVALVSLLGIIKSLFFIIVGLCGIGFLIGFHELGHFLFCKLFGIRTPSFSIGMGPRLFSKKIWDTDFTLSLLPIGGYVEIAGAREVGQGDQKEADRADEQSFGQKPYYQQLLVLLGGIFFNLMFAYAAVSAVFYFGAPKMPLLYPRFATATIEGVAEQSAAQLADLQVGDKIIAYNDTPITENPVQFLKYIKENPGKPVELNIERNGTQVTLPVTLGEQEIGDIKAGSLGVELAMPARSLVGALKVGFAAVNEWIFEILRSMAQLFTKRDFKQMGGPLMIVSMTIKSAQSGLAIFLLLLAFISVNLAVLNVFPLPIFDGGQVLFYTIEAIIGRPLPVKVREYIHIACWILLLILIVAMSIQDVWRMIFG
ncbi:MAG: RIP metalloprotease [Candidatus Babeliales bacterium]